MYKINASFFLAVTLFATQFLLCASQANAAGLQQLKGHVPSDVSSATIIGDVDDNQNLQLNLELPLQHTAGLQSLIKNLYDPQSAQYHRYLTPALFTSMFAPSENDYEKVIRFAKANGFSVISTTPNRLYVKISSKASNVEKVFHTLLHNYRRKDGTQFFAPDQEPSLDLDVTLSHIGGLDSALKVRHGNFTAKGPSASAVAGRAKASISSSSPGSTTKVGKNYGTGLPIGDFQGFQGQPGYLYTGMDFRNVYLPCVPSNVLGQGQTIALFEADNFNASDLSLYSSYTGIGLPNYQIILVDEASPQPPSCAFDEVTLDIEMAWSMAPKATILVYEGPNNQPSDCNTMPFYFMFNPVDELNQMAVDDKAQQISSSWTWSGDADPTVTSIFQEFAAQGQSFFQASGDLGAYNISSSVEPDVWEPTINTELMTVVGGTQLTTTANNGASAGTYVSETTWNNPLERPNNLQLYNSVSAGGYCAPTSDNGSGLLLPTWQNGIHANNSEVSTTYRNIPDVSMIADYIQITLDGGYALSSGTSAAAPLWAAFIALTNQQAAATGHSGPVGFANPWLYSKAGYPTAYNTNFFHDINDGSNNNYSGGGLYLAVNGYDLTTGLGSPKCQLNTSLPTWTPTVPATNTPTSTNTPTPTNTVTGHSTNTPTPIFTAASSTTPQTNCCNGLPTPYVGPKQPNGMAIDTVNQRIYTTNSTVGTNGMMVFNINGGSGTSFGAPVTYADMVVDAADGYLFATDNPAGKIHVFNLNGGGTPTEITSAEFGLNPSLAGLATGIWFQQGGGAGGTNAIYVAYESEYQTGVIGPPIGYVARFDGTGTSYAPFAGGNPIISGLNHPSGLVMNSTGTTLYVCEPYATSNGDIAPYTTNGTTYVAQPKVAVGYGPFYVRLDPTNSYGYVGSQGTGFLDVFDISGSTWTLDHQCPIPSPWGVGLANGYTYVALSEVLAGSNAITVLGGCNTTPTATPVQTNCAGSCLGLPTPYYGPKQPTGLAVDTNNSHIYTTNSTAGLDGLMQFNINGGAGSSFGAPVTYSDVTVDANGGYLFATDYPAGKVHVFNVSGSTPSEITSAAFGPAASLHALVTGIWFQAGGGINNTNAIYVSYESEYQGGSIGPAVGYVARFDGMNSTYAPYIGGNPIISGLNHPAGLTMNSTGTTLYVAEPYATGNGDIAPYSTNSSVYTAQPKVAVGYGPFYVRLDAGNNYAYIGSQGTGYLDVFHLNNWTLDHQCSVPSPWGVGLAGNYTYVALSEVSAGSNAITVLGGCNNTSTPTFTSTFTRTNTPTYTFTSTPTFTNTPTATCNGTGANFLDTYNTASSLSNYNYFDKNWNSSNANGTFWSVTGGVFQNAPTSIGGNTVGSYLTLTNSVFPTSLSTYVGEGDFNLGTGGPGIFGLVFLSNPQAQQGYIFQWNGLNNRWEIEKQTGPGQYYYPAVNSTNPYTLGSWVHLKIVLTAGVFNAYETAETAPGVGLGTAVQIFSNAADNGPSAPGAAFGNAPQTPAYISGTAGLRSYSVVNNNKLFVDNFHAYDCLPPFTSTPTRTSTWTPTPTATFTHSNTPTPTPTFTFTYTFSSTPTSTTDLSGCCPIGVIGMGQINDSHGLAIDQANQIMYIADGTAPNGQLQAWRLTGNTGTLINSTISHVNGIADVVFDNEAGVTYVFAANYNGSSVEEYTFNGNFQWVKTIGSYALAKGLWFQKDGLSPGVNSLYITGDGGSVQRYDGSGTTYSLATSFNGTNASPSLIVDPPTGNGGTVYVVSALGIQAFSHPAGTNTYNAGSAYAGTGAYYVRKSGNYYYVTYGNGVVNTYDQNWMQVGNCNVGGYNPWGIGIFNGNKYVAIANSGVGNGMGVSILSNCTSSTPTYTYTATRTITPTYTFTSTPTNTSSYTSTPTVTNTPTATCNGTGANFLDTYDTASSLSNYNYFDKNWNSSTAGGTFWSVVGGVFQNAPTGIGGNTVGSYLTLNSGVFPTSLSTYVGEGDFNLGTGGPGIFGLVFLSNPQAQQGYIFQWNGLNNRWEIEKQTGPGAFYYPAVSSANPYTLGTWVHLKITLIAGVFNAYETLETAPGLGLGTTIQIFSNAMDNGPSAPGAAPGSVLTQTPPYISGTAGLRSYNVVNNNKLLVDNFHAYDCLPPFTSTPTSTSTWTPTNTPTPTATFTHSNTPTPTPTFTFTYTFSSTPTSTSGLSGCCPVGVIGMGQINDSHGLAIDQANHIMYVADGSAPNGQLQAWNLTGNTGNLINSTTSHVNGIADVVFDNEAGVTYVFAANYNGSSVEEYTFNGNFQWVKTIGSYALAKGLWFQKDGSSPGVNSLYITGDGGSVQRYDGSGTAYSLVTSFNGTAASPSLFVDPPTGNGGTVYVVAGLGIQAFNHPAGTTTYNAAALTASSGAYYTRKSGNYYYVTYGNGVVNTYDLNWVQVQNCNVGGYNPWGIGIFNGNKYVAVANSGAGNGMGVSILGDCATSTPTYTYTYTRTATPTSTWTPTVTGTATFTPTSTATTCTGCNGLPTPFMGIQGPNGIALDTLHNLIYSTSNAGGLVTFSATGGSASTFGSSSGQLGDVALDVSGDYLFAANYPNGSIDIYKISTGAVVNHINLPPSQGGLAVGVWFQQGGGAGGSNALYFSYVSEVPTGSPVGYVNRYDGSGSTYIVVNGGNPIITGVAGPLQMNAANNMLYIANTNNLKSYSYNSGVYSLYATTNVGAYYVRLDATNTRAYVANQGGSQLEVYDVDNLGNLTFDHNCPITEPWGVAVNNGYTYVALSHNATGSSAITVLGGCGTPTVVSTATATPTFTYTPTSVNTAACYSGPNLALQLQYNAGDAPYNFLRFQYKIINNSAYAVDASKVSFKVWFDHAATATSPTYYGSINSAGSGDVLKETAVSAAMGPCGTSNRLATNVVTVSFGSYTGTTLIAPYGDYLSDGNGYIQVASGSSVNWSNDYSQIPSTQITFTGDVHYALYYNGQLISGNDPCGATPLPTCVPTNGITSTFTPTYTFSATRTPTPTWTGTSTATPTATGTPTPSYTFTPTPSFTYTYTFTNTFTVTDSATPTWTPTATNTWTLTFTGTPTSTSTPTVCCNGLATPFVGGANPEGLAINAPANLMYVANPGGGMMAYSLNGGAGTNFGTGSISDVVIDQAGGYIIAANYGGGQIQMYNIAGYAAVGTPWTLPNNGLPRGLWLQPGGGANGKNALYVSYVEENPNGNGTVLGFVNRYDGTGTTYTAWPGNPVASGLNLPTGLTMNLAGTTLYVGNSGAGHVESYSYNGSTYSAATPVVTGDSAFYVRLDSSNTVGYVAGLGLSELEQYSINNGVWSLQHECPLPNPFGVGLNNGNVYVALSGESATNSSSVTVMNICQSTAPASLAVAARVAAPVKILSQSIGQGTKTPTATPSNTPTATPTGTPTMSPTPSSLLIAAVAGPNLSKNGEPIKFMINLGSAATVQLHLFSLMGQEVFSDTIQGGSGMNTITWLLDNKARVPVASGLYVYTIRVIGNYEQITKTGKVVVLH